MGSQNLLIVEHFHVIHKCIKIFRFKFNTIIIPKHFDFLVSLIFHICFVDLKFGKDFLFLMNEIKNHKPRIFINKNNKIFGITLS
jgi:hypothetical protein